MNMLKPTGLQIIVLLDPQGKPGFTSCDIIMMEYNIYYEWRDINDKV